MSRYGVNSVLYRLKKDPDFRARFTEDAAGALKLSRPSLAPWRRQARQEDRRAWRQRLRRPWRRTPAREISGGKNGDH